ncbi:GntR family transcriptional regulator [Arthrobacter bambusae]|uniref:GntR family transcriptional regulator n=1 Tax=Arthrobacter bambusae TaxID=1338426 RepID=UPI002786FDA2|nr:GntR family transcriptional regulator [Arthrobacter bambusae]MDQ0029684.1 GntR family transcriptional regulator [Arthrobacter bambusae]MDQ0097345.1 GntR family transcriptional regulator [Arthrobacter bambusae]
MHDDAVRFLSQPVEAQPGSPLRVVVYSRIAEAIRNNLLHPGSMLPTETELGTDMKVSRTVVREALMLLEEDGLIRARRGVGRFVADTLPRIGIERIRPFEEVLGGPGKHVEIKRTQVVKQPASEFAAPGVGINPGDDCWLWESVLIRDGEPIAQLQENISALPVSFAGGAVAPLEIDDDGGTTLLAALNKAAGNRLGPGECQIGLSQVGPSRAKLLDLRASDPVLVLTQYVRHANRPFYLAKCLIADRAGHLSVMQTLQS